MKKKWVTLLVVGVMVGTLVGCGSSSKTTSTSSNTAESTENSTKVTTANNEEASTSTAAANSGEGKQIAYITPSLDLPYWRYLANGIENEVIDSGMNAKVQIYDSKNSNETQLQNAQDAISQGSDIIIISPTDSSSCPSVLDLAKEADIPVVIADVGTDSGEYDAFIITPNEQGSQGLGEYVLEYMKDNGITGKAAQITGSLARNNIKARYDGFNKALDEYGVELADYQQMSDMTRAEGESLAQDLMTTYSDLSVIFCHMDEPTLGVAQAVQNADKQDSVVVCGFDGTPETVTDIENGTILAAAIQQPALFGKTAVECAQKIFDGETIEDEIEIPTLLVTKENVNNEDVQNQLKTNVFPDSKADQ
ncbi:MAG: substrate-binding domain-containing protein [Eubacterium sp.]|nr:substrate-binding domain-containing protein [Eubacterium sp.]